MVKLFYKGARKGLQVSDLYQILKADKSEKLGNALEKNWNQEVIDSKLKGRNPSLVRALSKTFFWLYMFFGFLMFVLFVGLRYVYKETHFFLSKKLVSFLTFAT